MELPAIKLTLSLLIYVMLKFLRLVLYILDFEVKAPVVYSRMLGANCSAVFLTLAEDPAAIGLFIAFLKSVSLICTSVEGIIKLSFV